MRDRQAAHRPQKSSTARLALTLAFLGVAGCNFGPDERMKGPKHPFQETVTQLVYATQFEADPIYWLDKDRVLIPGYAPEEGNFKPGEEPQRFGPVGLYILDTSTNRHTRYSNLYQQYVLCYNDGFITYRAHEEGNPEAHILYEGQFGSEQKSPNTAASWTYGNDSYAHCPIVDRNKIMPPEHVAAKTLPLRPGDGYLYIGERRKDVGDILHPNDPVKLHRPGQSEPLILPILAKEFRGLDITYSGFANKYIVIPHYPKYRDDPPGHYISWSRSEPSLIYQLSPDGQVQMQYINSRYPRPHVAFLTQRGLFWVSNEAWSGNSRNAGGWLLQKQDGEPLKLFEHLVSAAGVSPDGCKIAYANNDANPKTREYIRIINVCQ